MKTLMLLRHGEAAPTEQGKKDIDRILTKTGRYAMQALGEKLIERGLLPQFALCSHATRTQQTLVAVTGGRQSVEVKISPGLYNADAEKILLAIGDIDDAVQSVLIVAHNAGIHKVACSLAREGDSQKLDSLFRDYSSGTLTILECPVESWSDIQTGRNRLIDLIVPK